MRAYISGPLHCVDDLRTARKFYELLAETCRECGWQAYVPHQFTDPERHSELDAAEIFRRDLRAVREADLLVACIGTPSSGVGAELGIAYSEGKLVVALHNANESPSRFLLGLLSCSPGSRLVAYRTIAECLEGLRQCLQSAAPLRVAQTSECEHH
jgi:nucleoside 2-deoxyribosyltransferase